MKAFLAVVLYVFGASCALAYTPYLATPNSSEDIISIEDPGLAQTFYGTLSGFPHTYEIRAETPFTLTLALNAPATPQSQTVISGIIIKEREGGGRVEEVAALTARDAAWDPVFDARSGDTYRVGPAFTRELGAGTYRIEVHTPDNIEKYILAVGAREEMTLGYIEFIRRLAGVKSFFEKSQFLIIESPYVYIPLGLLIILGLTLWYLRARMHVR